MTRPNENGFDAANAEPVKTLSKCTHDFIASGTGEQLSFLPPPPFCPIWPTKNTLADVALRMLMDGRLIDHNDFIDHTRSWRLGAVIFTLRTLGWPVETIEIPSPTEQSPDRVIALYRLDAKYTAQALALNGGAVC